jgi:nucleoside-diphosphate-sugar epimerase
MNILITGSSGFVGKNLVQHLKNKYNINCYLKGSEIKIISENVVLHLAGKAHDLKNTADTKSYYQVNTDLTKSIFDAFIVSNANVFITISSVKAVADQVVDELTENIVPNPITHYGKSKLYAENYILSKKIPESKRVYILRPCMIHGPGNKGNLNMLYKYSKLKLPWPLGKFENKRSYCSIDNLCFLINELIERIDIPSGIYNVADDVPLSTNEVINLISKSREKCPCILNIPKSLIKKIAFWGDIIKLPFNSERLSKLTESYVVSNSKITKALNKPFPISSSDGLLKTFKSFSKP